MFCAWPAPGAATASMPAQSTRKLPKLRRSSICASSIAPNNLTRAPATALAYTHYEKVVEACGGAGFWVERAEDIGPALDQAIAAVRSGVPACVNVKIAKSDFRKGAISV